jgi:hypothetical protein
MSDHSYTKNAGVISGNLSDRFLADHGNIFGAAFLRATIMPQEANYRSKP